MKKWIVCFEQITGSRLYLKDVFPDGSPEFTARRGSAYQYDSIQDAASVVAGLRVSMENVVKVGFTPESDK